MSKYIIKNCPAILRMTKICDAYETTRDNPILCKERCDCVLKQIVEKCKKYIENYNDKVFYDNDDVKILMGKVMLSQSILCEILDIQEGE